MTSDYVVCPEVTGKTIHCLRVYRDSGDGNELQIDLTDGTSFVCCFSTKTNLEASVIRAGIGEPEVLHRYEMD